MEAYDFDTLFSLCRYIKSSNSYGLFFGEQNIWCESMKSFFYHFHERCAMIFIHIIKNFRIELYLKIEFFYFAFAK